MTITAANGVKAELDVTVVKKGKGGTAIGLSKKSATVTRRKTLTLKASLTPSTPKNKKVIWTSSNESIATVDSTGKITAVANGEATILRCLPAASLPSARLPLRDSRSRR